MTARSRLRPIAIDRQRPLLRRLHDEVRNDTSVVFPRARSVGVEYLTTCASSSLARKSHYKRLTEPLGFVVTRPWTNRVDVPPVTLALRMLLRITIGLGGGGEGQARAPR